MASKTSGQLDSRPGPGPQPSWQGIFAGFTARPRVRKAWAVVRETPVGRWIRKSAFPTLLPSRYLWIRVSAGPNRGRMLLCDPRYEVAYICGDYEPWLVTALKESLKPGGLFIDIGAHAGYLSLLAAELVGATGGVIAFEADPENAARLRENVSANGLGSRIVAIEAAVWSVIGDVVFGRAGQQSSLVEGRVVLELGVPPGQAPVTVQALTLDSFLPRFLEGRKFLQLPTVKVDVEGGEVEVLSGAVNLLRQHARWIIEVHGAEQEHELIGALVRSGYQFKVRNLRQPDQPDYYPRFLFAAPGEDDARWMPI